MNRTTRRIGVVVVVTGALLSAGAMAGVAKTSDACFDGGGTEPVPPLPAVTAGAEAGSNFVRLCYGTTPVGSGAPSVTGGAITAAVDPATGSASVTCAPDAGTVTASCNVVEQTVATPVFTLTVQGDVNGVGVGQTGLADYRGLPYRDGAFIKQEVRLPCLLVNGTNALDGACGTYADMYVRTDEVQTRSAVGGVPTGVNPNATEYSLVRVRILPTLGPPLGPGPVFAPNVPASCIGIC